MVRPMDTNSSGPSLTELFDMLSPEEETDWLPRALCSRRNSTFGDEIFFLLDNEEEAAAICNACPVRPECLIDVLKNPVSTETSVHFRAVNRKERRKIRKVLDNPDVKERKRLVEEILRSWSPAELKRFWELFGSGIEEGKKWDYKVTPTTYKNAEDKPKRIQKPVRHTKRRNIRVKVTSELYAAIEEVTNEESLSLSEFVCSAIRGWLRSGEMSVDELLEGRPGNLDRDCTFTVEVNGDELNLAIEARRIEEGFGFPDLAYAAIIWYLSEYAALTPAKKPRSDT